MNKIDQATADFKIELSKEWMVLQTIKWRRPKWIKLPCWLLEDSRWFKLSDEAKATWISLLLIAVENPGSPLPDREVLFRRLQALGNVFQAAKFDRIILELIQCGFLTKTTPELQSYRASELQKDKKEEDLNNGCPIKDGDSLKPIAQPHLSGSGAAKFVPRENLAPRWSVPRLTEITGTAEANRIRTEFTKRPESRQRSIDSARLSFIASNPREGSIIRQCRRCFIAHNGLARLRDLLRWSYPEFDRFEHWRRWSVYRALKRLGARRIGWGMYASR